MPETEVEAGTVHPQPRVGIVFVSHSAKIAEGLIELASQMAPTVLMSAAGGTDDGRIGTSFEKVTAGISAVDAGAGVVIICDLGSAILTAETAVDFLDDDVRGRVRIVDAPLVEGGVAASVAAEIVGGLDAVAAAAESAGATSSEFAVASANAPSGYSRTVALVNKDGLHARPAAQFVKLANSFTERVTVNGTDARSLLGIMALGLTKGMVAEVSSPETGSRGAVDALADLIETGFGEP
ncbi:dihydroxyacetone kinase phosphoryl donor subunit DhaM [Luethyella okanaganae]|uniref:Phosphocarrier protein HPr n=1 Tax=Luethyella okanaganae TaxID=69372 RepID=A0ABW1VD31_9MICO